MSVPFNWLVTAWFLRLLSLLEGRRPVLPTLRTTTGRPSTPRTISKSGDAFCAIAAHPIPLFPF
jgi:hypothetical protein